MKLVISSDSLRDAEKKLARIQIYLNMCSQADDRQLEIQYYFYQKNFAD